MTHDDKRKYGENLAAHVIRLATLCDDEKELAVLKQCCLLTEPRDNDVDSLVLVHNTEVLNCRMRKLDDYADVAVFFHTNGQPNVQYDMVVALIAALVRRAVHPNRVAEGRRFNVKALAACWVAFLVSTLRRKSSVIPPGFEDRYRELGNALFAAVGLKLKLVDRSTVHATPSEATMIRRHAGVMMTVFVAGTRLHLRWKQQRLRQIQSNFLLASTVVQSVAGIAAEAMPAARAATGPLALVEIVLSTVFEDWNDKLDDSGDTIKSWLPLYFPQQVKEALKCLSPPVVVQPADARAEVLRMWVDMAAVLVATRARLLDELAAQHPAMLSTSRDWLNQLRPWLFPPSTTSNMIGGQSVPLPLPPATSLVNGADEFVSAMLDDQ